MSKKFNYEAAKEAGYSDSEIDTFLAEKNPKFKYQDAKKSGYSTSEIADHLSSYSSPPSSEEYTESVRQGISQGGRLAAQAGKGAFAFHPAILPFELAGQGAKALGKAEALQAYDELEESLPRLMELYPQMFKDFKGLDRESYNKAVEEASGGYDYLIPSQYINKIAESAGIDLTPKNKAEEFAEILGAGGAAGKGLAEKGTKALLAGAVKSGAETAGVPEPISDVLSLVTSHTAPTNRIGNIGQTTRRSAQAASESIPVPKEEFSINKVRESISKARQAPDVAIEEGLVGQKKLPKSSFELAESALEDIKPITEGAPLGIEVNVSTPKGKTLEGRVEAEPKLGQSISKSRFSSEAEGGRSLSNEIRSIEQETVRPIEEAYKKAEAVTRDHNAIFPELAAKNDALIEELEFIPRRNAGQEAVYKVATDLKGLIGTTNGLIEANASKLMKQADSFSKAANYELPFTGYKGRIKTVVRDINQDVIKSLEQSGKDAQAVIKADKLYADKADRFFGDEIAPYLQKNAKNQEQLFRKAASDESTYRAIKRAVGERDSELLNKLDRVVVETRLGKYYKKPQLVNTDEYVSDLNNTSQLIGKKKTSDVDKFLRDKQSDFEASKKIKGALEEKGKKFKASEKPETKLDSLARKMAENKKTTPEDILKKLNSRSGIRQLRKELSEDAFEKLTSQKIRDVLREGHIEKNFKGDDLYKLLNKTENFELFSEIVGEEATESARQAAKKIGNRRADLTNFLSVLGGGSIGIKLIKVVNKLI